uniref:Uncharacterized protein n=1 Tax=Tetranychus urticae TaxID=32264 RepID=T1K7G1_TETUR
MKTFWLIFQSSQRQLSVSLFTVAERFWL